MMTQISFPLEQAGEALEQFLNDGDREHDGTRIARNVLDAKGKATIAVILDPADYNRLREDSYAWQESQEPKDAADLPPGYRPYIHSPNATTDRLLPTEPLHAPLAHAMFRKPYDDLEQPEKDRVTGVAIACLLRTTLDADTQGAVPILMFGHSQDDPQPRQFWQLAYKTDVDGLFLRAEANGFFGEEWGIVTGAGWRLRTGWLSQDDAARTAAAISRVLPYIDWMSADADALTERSRLALRDVIRRHHPFGINDKIPEPEPLTADEPEAPAHTTEPADTPA